MKYNKPEYLVFIPFKNIENPRDLILCIIKNYNIGILAILITFEHTTSWCQTIYVMKFLSVTNFTHICCNFENKTVVFSRHRTIF